MANQIFKGDIGTEMIINIGSDTTEATLAQFHMIRPSGSKRIETLVAADVSTEMKFYASADTWTESGQYICQSYVEYGEENYWGEIVRLTVHEPEGDATV